MQRNSFASRKLMQFGFLHFQNEKQNLWNFIKDTNVFHEIHKNLKISAKTLVHFHKYVFLLILLHTYLVCEHIHGYLFHQLNHHNHFLYDFFLFYSTIHHLNNTSHTFLVVCCIYPNNFRAFSWYLWYLWTLWAHWSV